MFITSCLFVLSLPVHVYHLSHSSVCPQLVVHVVTCLSIDLSRMSSVYPCCLFSLIKCGLCAYVYTKYNIDAIQQIAKLMASLRYCVQVA